MIGKYKKIKPLGVGTIGETWVVKDSDGNEYAAKIMSLKSINEDTMEKALNAVKPCNSILSCVDHFKDPSCESYAIVSQYFPSIFASFLNIDGSLRSVINEYSTEKKTIPEEKIKNTLLEILRGLKEIHSMSIYHNNLKPENVLISNTMNLKIADVGLTSFSNHEIINYMSPEQCQGKDFEKTSDIWALGCIMYEMCTLEVNYNTRIESIYWK